jgi:NADPH:quinone reductase-like Zn-dependent oxidoreductase
MKAAVINEHGPLDCVTVAEIAGPEPAADEVLVKVCSAGLNHLDVWVRKGRPGMSIAMPHVLGSDAAGVVWAVGQSVRNIKAGDEVILNPGLSCHSCEFCMRGQHSQCVSYGIIGMSRPGAFAEYVAVPARNVFPKPSHLSFDEAGAFVLAYLTAWRMLFTRAQLHPGQMLLIHGIGGGVALAALQLAKLAHAEAIVTSSSDDKLARAQRIGADHLINYRNTDVADAVRTITGGRGVDVVVDTVGAAAWPIDFAAARRGGKIILCGVTSGAVAETNLQLLYWNQLTVLGSTMGSQEDFRQMLSAVNAAQLVPVVDTTLPLEKVKKAMGRMEAAEQFGKIVLKISERGY